MSAVAISPLQADKSVSRAGSKTFARKVWEAAREAALRNEVEDAKVLFRIARKASEISKLMYVTDDTKAHLELYDQVVALHDEYKKIVQSSMNMIHFGDASPEALEILELIEEEASRTGW